MSSLTPVLLLAAVLSGSPIEKVFNAGETLDYQLTWLRITAGSARMTIAPLPGDPSRMRMTSIARSSPRFSRIVHVHDALESVVARTDFSTLQYTKRLNEKGDQSLELTSIDKGVAVRTKEDKVTRVAVPRPVFDPISLIYYVRLLDLTVGRRHQFTLISDGKIYTVVAHAARKERIRTPAGTFNTVVVEPAMTSAGKPREERLWIWYTDDERRLPVRIRTQVAFGSVTASLRAVTGGVTSVDPPLITGD